MGVLGQQGSWPTRIAEVLLVVVGILVALWLDDWNESRKDSLLEIQYLEDLAEDLNLDIVEIARTRDGALGRLLVAQRLLVGAGGQPPSFSEEGVDLADTVDIEVSAGSELQFLLDLQVLDGSSTAFDELRSSGNLRVIGDRDVVRTLSQYYSQWADAVEGDINRMRPDAAYLRGVLSRAGLAIGHDLTSEEVHSIISRDPILGGELRQLHWFAQRQVWRYDTFLLPLAESALTLVEARISEVGGS